jgi:hypothetical protein
MAFLTGYERPLSQFSRSELIQIAQNYSVYYTTKSGQGRIGNYNSLTKLELISIISNDPDYKQKKISKKIDQDVKTEQNRVKILQQKIRGIDDPTLIMDIIMKVFSETSSFPQPGNYFTFVYNAKTPKLLYDQHPLVAVLSTEEWGFKGINFHWGTQRNYTWAEVGSLYHVINNDEINDMKNIPYAKFLRVP